MIADISAFRSVLFSYDGLAGLNSYLLEFPIPPSLEEMELGDRSPMREAVRYMKFFCNVANLPGVGLATQNVPRYGYGAHEKKPWFPIFNDVMMTFYNDGGSINLQVFQQWLASIENFKFSRTVNDSKGAFGSDIYEVSYKSDYAVDARLTLYDNSDQPTYIIVMRDFFPVMIPETLLGWETVNQIMQVTVMFTYTDWYLMRPEVVAGPGQPAGASEFPIK